MLELQEYYYIYKQLIIKEQGESELYDISISQIVEAYNDGILDEETKIILQKLDSV